MPGPGEEPQAVHHAWWCPAHGIAGIAEQRGAAQLAERHLVEARLRDLQLHPFAAREHAGVGRHRDGEASAVRAAIGQRVLGGSARRHARPLLVVEQQVVIDELERIARRRDARAARYRRAGPPPASPPSRRRATSCVSRRACGVVAHRADADARDALIAQPSDLEQSRGRILLARRAARVRSSTRASASATPSRTTPLAPSERSAHVTGRRDRHHHDALRAPPRRRLAHRRSRAGVTPEATAPPSLDLGQQLGRGHIER